MRMPRVSNSRAVLALLALAGLAAACAARAQARPAPSSFSPHVGASGEIARPVDYRTRWVHLGSWAVHDESGAGHGFHDVYAQPEAVAAYKARQTWPDGAVLIKEIRPIHAQTLSTGALYRAEGEPAVVFVMVKDATGRFPGNASWGNGWGWAMFNQESPTTSVSKDHSKDCLGCHEPARASDWVYVEGYPTLGTR